VGRGNNSETAVVSDGPPVAEGVEVGESGPWLAVWTRQNRGRANGGRCVVFGVAGTGRSAEVATGRNVGCCEGVESVYLEGV